MILTEFDKSLCYQHSSVNTPLQFLAVRYEWLSILISSFTQDHIFFLQWWQKTDG